MRVLLFILTTFTTYASMATTVDSMNRKKWRIEIGGIYGIPQGSFSYRTNDRFLLSQCAPATGNDLLLLGYTFARHFTAGLYFSFIPYDINKDKITPQLHERYDNPGFYTSIAIDRNYVAIWATGIQCSYIFAYTFVEIEPYLQLGSCIGGFASDMISVTRKRKGENFSEEITPVLNSKSFFYPGVGVKLNKRIWKGIYTSLGVRYNNGTMKYTYTEEVEDYLETKTERSYSFTQAVTAVQVHAGIQYRFKFPKKMSLKL